MKIFIFLFLTILIFSGFQITLIASNIPEGFRETRLATGLNPTALRIANNGNIYICEKDGKIKLYSNGVIKSKYVLSLDSIEITGEAGMQDMILDPDFETNGYYYVYYTTKRGGTHNVLSRFKSQGDTTDLSSETVLISLPPIINAPGHNGGGMAFGLDGKIYLSIGEAYLSSNAQDFNTLLGKVIRINSDGTIPSTNPFYSTLTGINRAIYALGFRNPFKMGFDPITGKIYVNDVGNDNWEEINEIIAGKNYGWPITEGPNISGALPQNYQSPVHYYNHANSCAITGGAFYRSNTTVIPAFPTSYYGKYFFGDYCNGQYKMYNPLTSLVSDFTIGINRPLDIAFDQNTGIMYYIARGTNYSDPGSENDNTLSLAGELWKVEFRNNDSIAFAFQPQNIITGVGTSSGAYFNAAVSGKKPIQYTWYKNGNLIVGQNNPYLQISNPTIADDNSQYQLKAWNYVNTVTSNVVYLYTTSNNPPLATITSPLDSTYYTGGDIITLSGFSTDREEGILGKENFSWKIDFCHDSHTHPALDLTSNQNNFTFKIPNNGETASDVWYRIYLYVKDSTNSTTTVTRDVLPKKTNILLNSKPQGLILKLDGHEVMTPYSFTSIQGVKREIEVDSIQIYNGTSYAFVKWSNDSARHSFVYPVGSDLEWNAQFKNNDSIYFSLEPQNINIEVGSNTSFITSVKGKLPIYYVWYKNDTLLTGENSSSLQIINPQFSDDNSKYQIIAWNAINTITSDIVTLSITSNRLPIAAITSPLDSSFYSGGDIITLLGIASDREDGVLGKENFSWKIDFFHDSTASPALALTTNQNNFTYQIPNTGQTSLNVWYRIYLHVKDSDNATTSVVRDLLPNKTNVVLNSHPQGLTLKLEGIDVVTPYTFTSVEGIAREIEADTMQQINDSTYFFSTWSNNLTRHSLVYPIGKNFEISAIYVTSIPSVITTTSINDKNILETNTHVYPNPSSNGLFAVPNSGNIWTTYQVIDTYGKIVITETLMNNIIDISAQRKGIYFLKLKGTHKTIVEKILYF